MKRPWDRPSQPVRWAPEGRRTRGCSSVLLLRHPAANSPDSGPFEPTKGKIHGTKMFQSRRRAWKHKRAGTSQLSSLMLLVVRGGCFWNVWELTTATTRAIFLPAHRGYLLFLRQISSVSWLYARRYTARKSRGHSSTARSFRSGIPRTGLCKTSRMIGNNTAMIGRKTSHDRKENRRMIRKKKACHSDRREESAFCRQLHCSMDRPAAGG